MITEQVNNYNSSVFYRITALWVICEAFAGGIMHGIKIPFSGMMVSSLAVFCIILMAWYVPSRTAILKATIIVAMFKLMLSPHSPPTAYIAVFFQGITGQLLLNRKTFTLSAMLVAVFSLVESALQRILVLMIVYGNDFWKAVNEFIKKVIGDKTISNYSLALAIGYIILHALVGLLIGYYAAQLVKGSAEWQKNNPGYLINNDENGLSDIAKRPKKNRIKFIFLVLWLILLIIYLQSALYPAQAIMPSGKLIQIFIRSLLILIIWYLFGSPLVTMLIKKGLNSQQNKNKAHIAATMKLLPETKMVFVKSWQLSKDKIGFSRIKIFVRILLVNVLGRDEFIAREVN